MEQAKSSGAKSSPVVSRFTKSSAMIEYRVESSRSPRHENELLSTATICNDTEEQHCDDGDHESSSDRSAPLVESSPRFDFAYC